jgi:hypothetical protein
MQVWDQKKKGIKWDEWVREREPKCQVLLIGYSLDGLRIWQKVPPLSIKNGMWKGIYYQNTSTTVLPDSCINILYNSKNNMNNANVFIFEVIKRIGFPRCERS